MLDRLQSKDSAHLLAETMHMRRLWSIVPDEKSHEEESEETEPCDLCNADLFIDGPREISHDQYETLRRCKATFPLRLQVNGASPGL